MPSTDDDVVHRGLDTLVSLREESKIELIGLSSVGLHQLDLAADVVDIACVQNQYGLLDRGGEDVLVACGERGIAFVPFFPLGSAFGAAPRPDEHPEVRRVAQRLGATPAQVALAWLLHHADHILLIPGTSSVAHLEENMGCAGVSLGDEDASLLDGLAAA